MVYIMRFVIVGFDQKRRRNRDGTKRSYKEEDESCRGRWKTKVSIRCGASPGCNWIERPDTVVDDLSSALAVVGSCWSLIPFKYVCASLRVTSCSRCSANSSSIVNGP